MKITYLDHSGFAVEYKKYVLIFAGENISERKICTVGRYYRKAGPFKGMVCYCRQRISDW